MSNLGLLPRDNCADGPLVEARAFRRDAFVMWTLTTLLFIVGAVAFACIPWGSDVLHYMLALQLLSSTATHLMRRASLGIAIGVNISSVIDAAGGYAGQSVLTGRRVGIHAAQRVCMLLQNHVVLSQIMNRTRLDVLDMAPLSDSGAVYIPISEYLVLQRSMQEAGSPHLPPLPIGYSEVGLPTLAVFEPPF